MEKLEKANFVTEFPPLAKSDVLKVDNHAYKSVKIESSFSDNCNKSEIFFS